ADDVWATGSAGIYHDAGNGFTFVQTAEGPLRVWGSRRDDVYFAGGHAIRHFDGSNISVVYEAPDALRLSDVWGSGASDVYAVGDAGTIVHYDGHSWSIGSHATWSPSRVWGSGPRDVFAFSPVFADDGTARSGGILHFDGTAW